MTYPGLWLTVVLVAVTAFRWRPLIGTGALRGSAGGLTGGELLPFGTDAEGIWRLWRDHWGGPGLGQVSPEQPFLPVLAALARVAELLPWVEDSTSGATVVGWLLIGAAPLSGITAYLAGRAATKAPWPRAAAGLIWGGLATVSTASAQGRLGPVVAHVLLPFVLAGVLTVARRRAGVPSTFGTVIAAAVLGAFAPTALIFTTVLALGVVVVGSGWARLRGAVVVLAPWALLGPWTAVRVLEEPRALLAGPGALSSLAPVEAWQLALAHPGGPGSYISWWTAPFLALGVLALGFPAPGRVRVVVGLGATALLGLAGGLATSYVTITAVDGAERSPWAGIPLDVMAAALLALALLVFGPRFRSPAWPQARGRRVGLAAAVAVVILGAGTVAGVSAWKQPVETLEAAESKVPGVAAHMAQGTRATRMLTFETVSDGSVTYRLDGRERGAPARDLDVPRSADPLLRRAVNAVLTAGSGDDRVPAQLADLAVGFVGVTGPGDRASITRALAGTEGLSPMASDASSSLWRVQPPSRSESVPVSRLRITTDGRLLGAVPTDDPNARTSRSIPDGPSGRVLEVAQAPGWGWHAEVTLDGTPLKRVPGAVPTYALPEDGGHLESAPSLAFPAWRWAQGLAAAAFIFLAIPFGNARSRERA